MIYDADNLKERLEAINEIKRQKNKRGSNAPYNDQELKTIIDFVGYIESNRDSWNDFNLKEYFEGSDFTYPNFRDIRKRYLKPKDQRQTENIFSDKPSKEYEAIKETKDVGRPKNEIKRTRIATYIDFRLNKKVRVYAALEGIGLNEVLERALYPFFKDKLKDLDL